MCIAELSYTYHSWAWVSMHGVSLQERTEELMDMLGDVHLHDGVSFNGLECGMPGFDCIAAA